MAGGEERDAPDPPGERYLPLRADSPGGSAPLLPGSSLSSLIPISLELVWATAQRKKPGAGSGGWGEPGTREGGVGVGALRLAEVPWNLPAFSPPLPNPAPPPPRPFPPSPRTPPPQSPFFFF